MPGSPHSWKASQWEKIFSKNKEIVSIYANNQFIKTFFYCKTLLHGFLYHGQYSGLLSTKFFQNIFCLHMLWNLINDLIWFSLEPIGEFKLCTNFWSELIKVADFFFRLGHLNWFLKIGILLNQYICGKVRQKYCIFRRIPFISSLSWVMYTANIFNVIFTVFPCVQLFTVIPLYCLHLIAVTVE